MNLLTNEGYKKLYSNEKTLFPIRYGYPNCGPADKACMAATKGNGDLSESDVNRMAAEFSTIRFLLNEPLLNFCIAWRMRYRDAVARRVHFCAD